MNQPATTMPRREAGVSTIGYCKDCKARWQGSNAAYDAIAHHESTGHNIRVEQTIFWERKLVSSQQLAGLVPKPRDGSPAPSAAT